jgi:hypothetical protein
VTLTRRASAAGAAAVLDVAFAAFGDSGTAPGLDRSSLGGAAPDDRYRSTASACAVLRLDSPEQDAGAMIWDCAEQWSAGGHETRTTYHRFATAHQLTAGPAGGRSMVNIQRVWPRANRKL